MTLALVLFVVGVIAAVVTHEAEPVPLEIVWEDA